MTQQKQAPAFVADLRAAKADRIARVLSLQGVDAAAAARLTQDERRVVEGRAGVKGKGSAKTWRSVVGMLAGSAAPGALCLTCGLGDPLGVDKPPQPWGHEGPCSK